MARSKKGTLLYGVGKSTPIKNATPFERKARKTWGGMLERCYSSTFKKNHPTYAECCVCDDWLDFSIFYKWYCKHYVEGWYLDKDLTVIDNKMYSPKTCCFVPRWLNNLLLDSASSRGKYPIGVTKDGKKYKARFSCNNTSTYLGLFKSVEEAKKAYLYAKAKYIIAKLYRADVPEQVRNTLKIIAVDLLGGY